MDYRAVQTTSTLMVLGGENMKWFLRYNGYDRCIELYSYQPYRSIRVPISSELKKDAVMRFINEHTRICDLGAWGNVCVEMDDCDGKAIKFIEMLSKLNPKVKLVKEILTRYAYRNQGFNETYSELIPFLIADRFRA